MRLDLYQAETARIAAEQQAILDEAHAINDYLLIHGLTDQ